MARQFKILREESGGLDIEEMIKELREEVDPDEDADFHVSAPAGVRVGIASDYRLRVAVTCSWDDGVS